jgi:hypothetical protein
MPLIFAIPEKYQEGFKELATIDEGTFAKIIEGFSYSSLVASVSTLVERISNSQGVNKQTVEQIFVSVASVMSFLESKESINEVIEDITKLSIEKNLFPENAKDDFKSRFLNLLDNKHIYYAAKGYSLMREHSNVFLSSRIITDIRPVFNLELESEPKAGLIIHKLHLHYQSDREGDHKDIFLSLDSTDLKILKDALTRAEKKEIALQTILKKAEITNLNE